MQVIGLSGVDLKGNAAAQASLVTKREVVVRLLVGESDDEAVGDLLAAYLTGDPVRLDMTAQPDPSAATNTTPSKLPRSTPDTALEDDTPPEGP